MRNKIFFVIFILVVVAGVGYVIWDDLRQSEVTTPKIEPEKVDNVATTTTAETSVETDALSVLRAKMPDLDRRVIVGADISPADKEKRLAEIAKLSAELEEKIDHYNGWMQLGLLRKSVEDFEGAIAVWEFTAFMQPHIATSFMNLGNLYGYYLHDNVKAEEYFLKAITADPKNIATYFVAHKFYLDALNDIVKAKAVLERGIKANPDTSKDLQAVLDSLK